MSETKRTDAIQGEIIHVYDDIEEADNSLPLWWLATFYGAIVFAVFYWFGYHEFSIGKLPAESYGAEVARRGGAGGPMTNETLDALAHSSAEVGAGRALFQTHCVSCHADRAQGAIGPNLTDDAWIHGGDPVQIHTTIRDGIAAKGMPAWGAPLGPIAIRRLAAYVVSIRNTNVAGKESQGEPWVPGGAPSP